MLRLVMINGILMHGNIIIIISPVLLGSGGINGLVTRVLVRVTVIHLSTEPFNGLVIPLLSHHQRHWLFTLLIILHHSS
jgi:hypothetical protein